MAVAFKYDSVISAESIERSYLITASSDADAYTQLVAHASCPYTLAGASVLLYRRYPVVKHIGGGYYESTVQWGLADQFADVSFSTSGGQQLVTQSLNTQIFGPDAPNHLGQIGVTKNGVEGVQITVPVFQWSESHLLENAVVTESYIDSLYTMTGTTNDATWRGKPQGEVLFMGATGQRRSADDWSLTFTFSRSQNVTSLTVGDITGINKKGWEYMWVKYVDDTDINDYLIRKPIGVYVERVYEESDFSDLGID